MTIRIRINDDDNNPDEKELYDDLARYGVKFRRNRLVMLAARGLKVEKALDNAIENVALDELQNDGNQAQFAKPQTDKTPKKSISERIEETEYSDTSTQNSTEYKGDNADDSIKEKTIEPEEEDEGFPSFTDIPIV